MMLMQARNALSLLAAGIALPLFARTILVPAQPVSTFADTEVTTNMLVNTGDISYEDLQFRFHGTPTNNLELAFGTDVNTNGVLDAEEVETRFGWRGGRYFIENARAWERCESAQTSSSQSFSVEMHLDVQYHSQQVRSVNVSGVNAAAFGNLVEGVPPAWVWKREWNMMRATRRGAEPPSDWIYYKAANHGFSVRLR